MIHERVRVLTLATCAGFFSDGVAQDQAPARFAEPVRIKAGDAFLAERRILPSPALEVRLLGAGHELPMIHSTPLLTMVLAVFAPGA